MVIRWAAGHSDAKLEESHEARPEMHRWSRVSRFISGGKVWFGQLTEEVRALQCPVLQVAGPVSLVTHAVQYLLSLVDSFILIVVSCAKVVTAI